MANYDDRDETANEENQSADVTNGRRESEDEAFQNLAGASFRVRQSISDDGLMKS